MQARLYVRIRACYIICTMKLAHWLLPAISKRTQTPLVILSLVVGVLLTGCSSNESSPSIVIDGLASPRGLAALADGRLLISEGGGGRLLLIDRQNRITVLQDNLPRLQDGPEGAPVGVSAAIQVDGTTYYVVGEARAKGFREVYALTPGSPPRPLTGQDPLGINPPNPLTNPYDLLAPASGGLLISDAGANAIWHVTLAGDISLYAELEPVTYNTADGAVYVATLTGFPFPPGAASIMQLRDTNGDGDALDRGETTVYATGFTAATDIAFDSDGSTLVTEYSQNMRELAEAGFMESGRYGGRLVRWRDGSLTVVATGLISPTAVAVMDLRIYVSEEFAGRVRIIEP